VGKIIVIIAFLLNATSTFAQQFDSLYPPYDPSFHEYLNNVRLTCLKKDTGELHQLFGDNLYGISCYGGALVQTEKPLSYWDEFKVYYGLIDQPEESSFWNFFLKMSNNGFFFNKESSSYIIPACHFWGYGYPADTPNYLFKKMFFTETIHLFEETSFGYKLDRVFTPKPVTPGENYPYSFESINQNYYRCFENDQFIGFVSSDDLISWNYNFSFGNLFGKWELFLFEPCN
jgi:hypothetical protein